VTCWPHAANPTPAFAAEPRKEHVMSINLVLVQPWVALVAGILILLFPRLLNIIVAVYLIVVGLSGIIR
jgi:hypothetical protein